MEVGVWFGCCAVPGRPGLSVFRPMGVWQVLFSVRKEEKENQEEYLRCPLFCVMGGCFMSECGLVYEVPS